MIQTAREIPEAAAEGKVKSIYGDIKSVLRVPMVPSVFRSLAVHPDFLQVAWEALKPNAQTMFFEERSADLWALAVDRTASAGNPPAIPEDVRPIVDVFRYLTPKHFLAVAALRAASCGQQPRLMELTRDEKRQIPVGVPDGATAFNLVDVQADPLLGEIAQTFGSAPCAYRALADSPDYLRSAWQAIQSLEGRSDLPAVERSLRRRAEEAVIALPYRMDIAPHVMRRSGLSEHEIDDVQRTLNGAYRTQCLLTIQLAFLATALGADKARQTPFPVAPLE